MYKLFAQGAPAKARKDDEKADKDPNDVVGKNGKMTEYLGKDVDFKKFTPNDLDGFEKAFQMTMPYEISGTRYKSMFCYICCYNRI